MPAFFIHGAPDTHRIWDPIRQRLSGWDTIAVDLPGFGSPVPPGFTATKEAYVDWLIARIEAVGTPVDIVGHDWGCVLALRVASLRPDLIRSWAAGDGPLNADYVWHPLAVIFQTPGKGEDYFQKFDASQFAEALRNDGVPGQHASETAARVDETMGKCLLSLYRSALTVGADWQPALDDIEAPGLVIWGQRDRSVPVENADILARDTRARRVLKLDAGHWWPVQQPDEAAAALQEHWRAAA